MEESVDGRPLMLRNLAWDMLPCDIVEEYLTSKGLPASKEVAEMEHEASHARLNQVGPIYPVMTLIAHLVGETQVGAIAMQHPELLDKDGVEEATMVYATQIAASSLAMLSMLIELDLVTVNKQVTGGPAK